MTFYCLFATQILAELLFALGIPYVGAGGLIYMIQCFNHDKIAVGLMNLVSIAVWVSMAGFHALIWIQLRRFHYPSSGEAADGEEQASLATSGNNAGYDQNNQYANGSDLLAEGDAAYQSRDFQVADTAPGLEKVEYDTEVGVLLLMCCVVWCAVRCISVERGRERERKR
jgi:SCAMP family